MPLNFNDTGLLAFHGDFTDGSHGILVALVPEPGGVVTAALAASTLLLRTPPPAPRPRVTPREPNAPLTVDG